MPVHIFDSRSSLVCRLIVEAGAKLPGGEISGEITQVKFDEMQRFIGNKKQALGNQSC